MNKVGNLNLVAQIELVCHYIRVAISYVTISNHERSLLRSHSQWRRGHIMQEKYQVLWLCCNGTTVYQTILGAVVGVSDFLMTTLAKGTVFVGKKIGTAVAESDVSTD